jgi:sugar phosphate isomerase/epimerase
MKFGISSYCLFPGLNAGRIDVFQAMEWMKRQGADYVEIVPLGIDLDGQPGLAGQIAHRARELGLEIGNYAVGGDVLGDGSKEAFDTEIARLKRQVDLAAELGSKRMRHDIVIHPLRQEHPGQFERDFPRFVEACGQIAEHASQYGITTVVENHGRYVVSSDRVTRLVAAVNRPNFRMLLDIGNFLCVDEDPVTAVSNSLPFAEVIHFKDFYIRPPYANPGEGWFQTNGGRYLRGAIFGQGDMDTRHIVNLIQSSGFDGPITLEFEGMEADELGTRMAFDNIRRLWAEAAI